MEEYPQLPAELDRRKRQEIIAVSELRRELAEIATPAEALDVATRASRMRDAYKLMNKSVEECNEVAEVYIKATWKFGDLVRDVPEGAPLGNQHARKNN